jgi:hypothetical protein
MTVRGPSRCGSQGTHSLQVTYTHVDTISSAMSATRFSTRHQCNAQRIGPVSPRPGDRIAAPEPAQLSGCRLAIEDGSQVRCGRVGVSANECDSTRACRPRRDPVLTTAIFRRYRVLRIVSLTLPGPMARWSFTSRRPAPETLS